jgi:iron complex transport system substrate-binding protein
MNPGLIVVAVTILLCSCRHGGSPAAVTDGGTACSARRFLLEEKQGYARLAIRDPWQNSRGTELIWYLVDHDRVIPEGIAEEQVIRVPVKRMICMSTTHLAMLRALDATDVLVGISGPGLVYDSLILDAVHRGKIADIGYEGNLNSELIVTLRPDLLMAYGVAAPSAGNTGRLSAMGVKVLYNADYLEEHPLARYEWIRLFGLLTDREAMADSLYREVSAAYMELSGNVSKLIKERPDVLLGAPWEDVWYVSPSNSYIGQLIEDAGGHYIFSDLSEAHSVPFSVEAVFERATEADIWINPGTAESLADIGAADHRMMRLPVYDRGGVWNNRNRMTGKGGNDYWESAVVRPDLLLRDMVSIIHPELLPDHLQYYFMRLK